MDSQLAGESEVKTAANKGNKPLIILTSILGFVFVLGIVGIISYTAAKSDDGIKAISQGKTSVSKDVVNNGVTTGTISGNLSYPSETVVPMEICAYQSNPDKTYCTSFAGSEIDPSDSYKIELPS
ncbi:hypothetical protein KC660_03470, partial [Candidatus Dojkabacteria bacterium]|nr:hypothetical protein [Candidatus Dojkabacteria bacterium]